MLHGYPPWVQSGVVSSLLLSVLTRTVVVNGRRGAPINRRSARFESEPVRHCAKSV